MRSALMDVSGTRAIAEFVAGARERELPGQAEHAAKRLLLDTIGCALGATGTELGRVAVEVAEEQSGDRGQATIIGGACGVGPLAAAYANGRLANLLDADETFRMLGHLAHGTLAAALATAEWRSASGKDFLTAFAVGYEVGARLGESLMQPLATDGPRVLEWNAIVGPSMAVFGAAAASAYLLQLEPDAVANCFGIAAINTPIRYSGMTNKAWTGARALPTVKYTDTGFGAQAGMLAAIVGAKGVTGPADVLDGHAFADAVRMPGGETSRLTAGLGHDWRLRLASIKPWPSCRFFHYPLSAVAELVSEHGIDHNDIDHIVLRSHPIVSRRDVFARRDDLHDIVNASFSAPHSTAMIALRVPAGPHWYMPNTMHDPRVLRLRELVTLEDEPTSFDIDNWVDADGEFRGIPSSATISAGGVALTRHVTDALGDPQRPLDEKMLKDKFLTMATSASARSVRGRAERIMDDLWAIDQMESIHDVTRQLRA